MTTERPNPADDSRRSLSKRGTVAAGASALAVGATAGTATAQDDAEIVVFGDDYESDASFDVATELEAETVSTLLRSATAGTDRTAFDEPDDWSGYVIDFGDEAVSLGLLFTEDLDLAAGDSETMSEDASFRNAALNLVEIDLD